jgi:hypothetical protein
MANLSEHFGFHEEAFVCHSELAFVNQEKRKVPGISSLFRRPQLSGISSSRI